MSQLCISVITVSYNAARTLVATLDSVAEQTHPLVEHIVVDGASTDGTQDLLRMRGESVDRWISEPDSGIYDAMNKGVEMATGAVVGFLNADDVFASERVLETVATEFNDPCLQACFGDLVYVDDRDPGRVVRYWKTGDFHQGAFSRGWVPPHPTFYARRELFGQLGSFDTKYRLAADFDLMLRFLELGRISCKYVPELFVRMRLGGATNSSIRNILQQNEEIVDSCRAHGLPLNIAEFWLRKIVARGRQFVATQGA